MALMPQTAGMASFSQTIAPLWFPFSRSGQLTEGVLFMTSLCNIIFPNWRVVEFDLVSLVLASSVLSPTEHDRTLNASLIGSAIRQPAILWEEINRYTCKCLGWEKKIIGMVSTNQFNLSNRTETPEIIQLFKTEEFGLYSSTFTWKPITATKFRKRIVSVSL